MLSPKSALLGGGLSIIAFIIASAPVAHAAGDEGHGIVQLANTAASVGVYERQGRIERLYGEAFSHGATPEASAEAFINANAGLFGVDAADLVPIGPFPDGRHTQSIMYNHDRGDYKFTGVYYTQQTEGIPVFRSRLTLLLRNEPGYPLVLASVDLRNLGAFEMPDGPLDQNAAGGFTAAERAVDEFGGALNLVSFTPAETVIWAGVDDMFVQPRLAHTFIGDNGLPATIEYQKWLFVTDALTGEILYQEDMILNADVTGNVSAWASPDHRADACIAEVVLPMPYARLEVGGSYYYADVNGDYVITGVTGLIDITSNIRGKWFHVTNEGGTNSTMTLFDVSAPGPADFVHNQAGGEFPTAEMNGYLQANIVRDTALAANPSYPVIATQLDWPVNVNLNDTCNAFYDYSSINFFRAGGGCNNTGFGDIVHHEYGHHLVQVGGSGQGAYGEGMGDTMGLLITGRSQAGVGFQNCTSGIRNANNALQYPCSGEIHYCGQLLSGCVWDTRAELMITEPVLFSEIIRDLAVNAILLHSGTGIAPSITVDYLTLDDDDGNILNGTPHYWEIADGFGAHNMDAPPLMLLGFEFPLGLPDILDPAGGTVVRVAVSPIAGEPEPDTGKIHYDAGAGWVSVPMTQIEPHLYEFVFPPIDCGLQVPYWFSASTLGGQIQAYPTGAPEETLAAVSAQSGEVSFADDFETNQGWTVSGNATDGQWDRGIPVDCERGDPPTDADGSGQCSLTDNSAANNCNSDVDGGTTILTSPVMDASGDGAIIAYWRWYSNTEGADPMNDIFEVEVSDNGGTTWVDLETVGPAGPQVAGGWYYMEFRVDDFVDLTDQFRIRFLASDLSSGSVVEAGVDGVKLTRFSCQSTCPADVNGDNTVNVLDLLQVLAAWGATGGVEDVNGDGVVNVLDLLEVLAAWGPC